MDRCRLAKHNLCVQATVFGGVEIFCSECDFEIGDDDIVRLVRHFYEKYPDEFILTLVEQ